MQELSERYNNDKRWNVEEGSLMGKINCAFIVVTCRLV